MGQHDQRKPALGRRGVEPGAARRGDEAPAQLGEHPLLSRAVGVGQGAARHVQQVRIHRQAGAQRLANRLVAEVEIEKGRAPAAGGRQRRARPGDAFGRGGGRGRIPQVEHDGAPLSGRFDRAHQLAIPGTGVGGGHGSKRCWSSTANPSAEPTA